LGDQLHRDYADEVDEEPTLEVLLCDRLELHHIVLVKRVLVPLEPAKDEVHVEERLNEPEQISLKNFILNRERNEEHVRNA